MASGADAAAAAAAGGGGPLGLRGLIDTIVANLELRVTNIHIRYEDPTSYPGHAFAIGVMLSEVSAHTVDEDGRRAFLKSDQLRTLRKVGRAGGGGGRRAAGGRRAEGAGQGPGCDWGRGGGRGRGLGGAVLEGPRQGVRRGRLHVCARVGARPVSGQQTASVRPRHRRHGGAAALRLLTAAARLPSPTGRAPVQAERLLRLRRKGPGAGARRLGRDGAR